MLILRRVWEVHRFIYKNKDGNVNHLKAKLKNTSNVNNYLVSLKGNKYVAHQERSDTKNFGYSQSKEMLLITG